MSDAQRKVNVFLDHVDGAVDQQKVDGELWVTAYEFREQWRNQQPADQGWRADANLARRRVPAARQRRFDLLELVQDRFGALIENPPIVRQREVARRPQQQWRAKMLFHRRDLAADRRQRTRQRP